MQPELKPFEKIELYSNMAVSLQGFEKCQQRLDTFKDKVHKLFGQPHSLSAAKSQTISETRRCYHDVEKILTNSPEHNVVASNPILQDASVIAYKYMANAIREVALNCYKDYGTAVLVDNGLLNREVGCGNDNLGKDKIKAYNGTISQILNDATSTYLQDFAGNNNNKSAAQPELFVLSYTNALAANTRLTNGMVAPAALTLNRFMGKGYDEIPKSVIEHEGFQLAIKNNNAKIPQFLLG